MSYLFFPRNTRHERFSIFKARLILVVAALVFCLMPVSTCRASDLDSLTVLEKKFFEHTYAADTQEARLDRLEKLVFGEIGQGRDSDRIAKLMAAVPELSGKGADPSSDPLPAGSPVQANGADNSTNTIGDNTSQDQPGPDRISDSSGYPTVSAMEQQLLGKTFVGLPVQKRLDQLEVHAFGKLSGSQDLSDRVDRLEDYIQNKVLHASKSNPSHADNAAYAGAPAANATIEQQLSWLETQLLGQTYPNRTVIERLQPLEATVFPTDPPDLHSSIPDQVHALMNAVELRLHTSSSGGNQVAYQPGGSYQQPGYRYPGNATYTRSQAGAYGQQTDQPQQPYAQQPSYQATQPNTSGQTAPRSHPFLNGLAKALGAVGSMALNAVGSGNVMMGGNGYGGVPGYYGGSPAGFYPGISW